MRGVPPSPQIVPVLIQAGGSPRGTRTAARFVDHIFGARKPIPAMAKQRAEVDAALRAESRDPDKVGIIWSTQVMVGETEAEAKRMRERLIDRGRRCLALAQHRIRYVDAAPAFHAARIE